MVKKELKGKCLVITMHLELCRIAFILLPNLDLDNFKGSAKKIGHCVHLKGADYLLTFVFLFFTEFQLRLLNLSTFFYHN